VGTLVITAFVFSDMLDGQMARMSGSSSRWGAFLDSTLDRFGDAAIFGGLAMYYVGPGDSEPLAALAIYCLVVGSITSYARARAESLGMEAKVGIAERADRLVAILAMTGLSDIFNVPVLIPVALGVLAVASTVTVVQRILTVRSQAKAAV
jgi:CDP-diacylglycerol---glycerol-3-phosphate 3-phosphatidyltransferase